MKDMGYKHAARLAVLIVYGSALFQGLTLVSFPASGTVLKEMKGFTDSQYGFIFIPQIVTAILGSVGGGVLARRTGLSPLLVGALIANALSQLGLGLAVEGLESSKTFYMVLGATSMLGLAFGICAAPLNTFPSLLFPQRRDAALVALHTMLGLGLSGGPLIAGWLAERNQWIGFPLFLLAGSILLAIAVAWAKFPVYTESYALQRPTGEADSENPLRTSALWVFAAIALLYAFAEGTFSNWSVIYLREERGIELVHATLALSVFWAVVAFGRLAISVLLLKFRAERIWLILPLLMISAFLLLPFAYTAASGIALFALAGLGCSAFFPITVSLASGRFPSHAAFVSSFMIASLMVGVGVGSYLIGPLRAALPLDRLYQFSAIYPMATFVLALMVTTKQLLKSDNVMSGS